MARYAVVIGVSEYEDPEITPVRFAARDAEAFAQCLMDECKFDDVRLLVTGGDVEPEHVAIVESLHNFAPIVKAEDLFVFYFAGHGIHTSAGSLLLASNSRIRMPELAAVPVTLLEDCLARLDASDRILILDACRNDPHRARGEGGYTLAAEFSRDVVAAARRADKSVMPATCILFSCSVGERAYEWPDRGHGVFTWYLLEAIRGAAPDAQGRLTVQGISRYVEEQVRRWAKKIGAPSAQTPWAQQVGSLRDICLATEVITAPREMPQTEKSRKRGQPKSVSSTPRAQRDISRLEAPQRCRSTSQSAPSQPAKSSAGATDGDYLLWREKTILRKLERLAKFCNIAEISLGDADATTTVPKLVAFIRRNVRAYSSSIACISSVVGDCEGKLLANAESSRPIAEAAMKEFDFDTAMLDSPLDTSALAYQIDLCSRAISIALLRRDMDRAAKLLEEAYGRAQSVGQLAAVASAYARGIGDTEKSKRVWKEAEDGAVTCSDYIALVYRFCFGLDLEKIRHYVTCAKTRFNSLEKRLEVAKLYLTALGDAREAQSVLIPLDRFPGLKFTELLALFSLVEALVDVAEDRQTAASLLERACPMGSWDPMDSVDLAVDCAEAWRTALEQPDQGIVLLQWAEDSLRRHGSSIALLLWIRLARAWFQFGEWGRAISAFRQAGKLVKDEYDVKCLREAIEELGKSQDWKVDEFLPKRKSLWMRLIEPIL